MFYLIALLIASSSAWTGQQPRLAERDGQVFLAFARDNTIQVMRSDDGGGAFAAMAAIDTGGKLAAGRRRGPRIAATSKAVLITGVVGAKGGGADGDIVLYRSTDAGKSWTAPTTINDVPGSAREGMHGMAANGRGVVVVTWLDLRAKGTRIYAAVSKDDGATWSPDTLVYQSPSGSVCECCHPSATVADDGRIAIMFRNQVDEFRDMYVARSHDGKTFEPAVKLGRGSWTLNACPMDGGEISLSSRQLTTVWRREDAIFLSTSTPTPTSTPDAPERQVATGRDPALATAGARLDVAWTTPEGIVLMRGDQTQTIGPGQFPVLLASDKQTLLAWEQQGQVFVRRIPR